MAVILAFFASHWVGSVFCQTFFLHRYGAHRQFGMSRGWERVFHLLTYLTQGSSYLNPRAYAILHRMHHAFSDTEHDPHSPVQDPNLLSMMWTTKKRYDDFAYRRVEPEARFDGGVPEWPLLDKLGQSWVMRVAWGAAYTSVYVFFAPSLWWFLLLPAHFVMGPIHGAIVNYCGHKYGYRNFSSEDQSRNTLLVDFVTLGELFQNNHHAFAMSPNFAVRRFEVDPTYPVILLLTKLGVLQDLSPQRGSLRKAELPRRPASVAPVAALGEALVVEEPACAPSPR
ncbi:MAG TPA: acyl-CoA desaturase [Polyangiaceae bacterium]